MQDFEGIFKQLSQKIDSSLPCSSDDARNTAVCVDCLGQVTSEWLPCPHPGAVQTTNQKAYVSRYVAHYRIINGVRHKCEYIETAHGVINMNNIPPTKRIRKTCKMIQPLITEKLNKRKDH